VAENVGGGSRPLDVPPCGAGDPFTADIRVDLNGVGSTVCGGDGDLHVRKRDGHLDQVGLSQENSAT
jgi:hypothetical protein